MQVNTLSPHLLFVRKYYYKGDVYVFLCASFLIMALVFFSGKGKGLIAGYNTASDEEKAKYDEKKLNRTYAVFCLILSVGFVLTGIIDKPQAIYFLLIPAVILCVILLVVLSNTYCKKSD